MSSPTEEEPIFASRSKDIVRYTESRIRLTEGAFSGELIDLRRSPWMIKPLEMWQDDRISNMLVLKGVGCGGTYVAECGSAYFTTVRPSNVGYQIHTKEKAKYLASRFFSKCKEMPEYNRRLPLRQQSTQNNAVWFNWPTNFTRVQESSETNAQSYRMDYMVADEPWQYPQGRYTEFTERTEGATPFATNVGVSTAPRAPTHDYYVAWLAGCQDEYHLCCPKCSQLFLPTIGEEAKKRYDAQVIHWDKEGSIDHQVTTCRLICPSCQAEFTDRPSTRLALLDGADYQPNNPTAPPDLYSCRWNSWVAWFVPFHKILRKYLVGLEAAATGDNSVIEDYVIKIEARAWEGITLNDKKINITGDYDLIESPHPISSSSGGDKVIWHAPDWELEDPIKYEYFQGRFAGVDVQQAHLWAWFIQSSSEQLGASRLLWCGKVQTWSELHVLLEFFKIPHWQVGVDISHGRGVEVALAILHHGWIALRGEEDSQNNGFVHTWEEGDASGKARFPYEEEPHPWDIGSHKGWKEGQPTELPVTRWSHGRIMDHLWNLRNGEGSYWGLPSNLEILEEGWDENELILNQLDSSRRLPKVAKTANTARRKKVDESWQRRNGHTRDDLWDCASMALTLMHMQRFFTKPPKEE